LAHKASLAGVEVQHELYEDCVHVFQAFPFLDAARRAFISSRNFVRNVLPRLQARSPQLLDGSAQEKLEHEIDSENIRVVRGDGVETGTGKQEVNEEMKEDEKAKPADKEEPEEYSSWGRSRSNSILHPLAMTATSNKVKSKPAPEAEVGTGTSNLRRIQSAFVLFPSEPSIPPVKNHSRTPSAQSFRPNYRRQSTSHTSISTLNMSKHATPAPSPSIRRKNASHPDITSLVEQWTNSGPANQTMMYKPYTKPS